MISGSGRDANPCELETPNPLDNRQPSDASRARETIIPKSPSAWGQVLAPNVACTGVTLTRLDVGTVPSPASTAVPTNTISATSVNTFRVIARNLSDTFSGVPQAVRARIRIADWGSTVANRQFAPWRDIPGLSPVGPNVFVADGSPAANNFSVGWSNAFVDDAGAFGRWVINYTCQNQGADTYCPKLTILDGATPAASAHQCMLIEIGAKDPAIKFQQSAVYRNMEFVGLSGLTEPATITLEGLKAASGVDKARDVYLYVQTINMPGYGSDPIWLDAKGMAQSKRYLEFPPAQPRAEAVDMRPISARPIAVVDASKPPRAYPQIGLFDTPVLTADQALTTAWPTYMVRVYFDTGNTSKLDGEELKVIEPMVPFGYYLEHAGPLYGFSHSIEGLDGAVLEQLEPNFYRVHIESEGKIRLRNTITAEEEPKDPCASCPPPVDKKAHCNCRLVGAATHTGLEALLLLLIGAGALRRRSAPRPSDAPPP